MKLTRKMIEKLSLSPLNTSSKGDNKGEGQFEEKKKWVKKNFSDPVAASKLQRSKTDSR